MTRAPIADLADGERTLKGAVAHYLARVLRLRAGGTFVAFDPARGLESDALVIHADGDTMAVRFGPLRSGRSLPPRGLGWIHGLSKADKCDAIVRDATELGATDITIAATSRSVVRIDDARGRARQARWARIAQEAARQCGRSDAPVVRGPTGWAEALASAPENHARFCLWERATDPLAPALLEALDSERAIVFACGPEGGLADGEAELARDGGWQLVSLGPLILRTETVAAAVLGAVRVWSGIF